MFWENLRDFQIRIRWHRLFQCLFSIVSIYFVSLFSLVFNCRPVWLMVFPISPNSFVSQSGWCCEALRVFAFTCLPSCGSNLAGDVPLSGCFSNVAVACDLVLVLVLIVLAPQCCFSRLLGTIFKNQEGPSSYWKLWKLMNNVGRPPKTMESWWKPLEKQRKNKKVRSTQIIKRCNQKKVTPHPFQIICLPVWLVVSGYPDVCLQLSPCICFPIWLMVSAYWDVTQFVCCLVWLVVSAFSDISFNGLPSLFARMPWAAQLSGCFFFTCLLSSVLQPA